MLNTSYKNYKMYKKIEDKIMNLKRLNERLQKLLEISDETASDFEELRRANAASAENRYQNAIKQGADKETLSKYYKDSKKASKLKDRAKDAMSKRYDRKVARQKQETQDLIRSLAEGTYEGNYAEAYDKVKNDMTDDQIFHMFNYYLSNKDGDRYSIFPSGWNSEEYGPYPAKLALALCQSQDAENLSDYYNMYYANHALSDGAIKIFQQAALETEDIIKILKDVDDRYIANMLARIEDNDFVNALLEQIQDWDERMESNHYEEITKILDE